MAGITTFLTMAYILAVNPSIFSVLASKGMVTNAVFTSTALAAIIGTLMMAIYAKKPFGLAPGMGLNAFFVFTVCLTMGYSWQFALTAILIEGLIFVILTMTRIRTLIVDSIPASIKRAIGAGIGIYIAFIGLKNAGIIVESSATFVTIGDLPHGSALLGSIGIVLTSVLIARRVPGALLIGILATSLIGIPMGITKFQGIMDTPPSIGPIFCQFEFHNIFTIDMAIVVFTFLFIDMFDTMGTLVGVCTKAGMMRKDGSIPGLNKAFMADAVATMAGACLGSSTTTTYVESAAGVAQGGRTGLTAFATALCFVVALFFAPIFLALHAVADKRHRPEQLHRSHPRIHHHRDDAAVIQHLRRHSLRHHSIRCHKPPVLQLEEAQPYALYPRCLVRDEIHFHLTPNGSDGQLGFIL